MVDNGWRVKGRKDSSPKYQSGRRKREGRKRQNHAPPHNSCRRVPLRLRLAHVVLVAVRLVDDLLGEDFFDYICGDASARKEKRIASDGSAVMTLIKKATLSEKGTRKEIVKAKANNSPSSVMTPIAPPGFPGVRLMRRRCARPVWL
jgi:hypothetical protein